MSPTFLLESSSRTYTEAIQVFLKPYVKKQLLCIKELFQLKRMPLKAKMVTKEMGSGKKREKWLKFTFFKTKTINK